VLAAVAVEVALPETLQAKVVAAEVTMERCRVVFALVALGRWFDYLAVRHS